MIYVIYIRYSYYKNEDLFLFINKELLLEFIDLLSNEYFKTLVERKTFSAASYKKLMEMDPLERIYSTDLLRVHRCENLKDALSKFNFLNEGVIYGADINFP